MSAGELVALVGALLGIVTGMIAWRKTRAESDNINVATSIELVNALRVEMDRVRVELDEQRKRRQELADELHSLQRSYKAEIATLRGRVATLETWIAANTTADPKAIA